MEDGGMDVHISGEELALVQKLGECFNDHAKLEQVHPWDHREFMHAIHRAQNIVMSRPVTEQLQIGVKGGVRSA